MKQVIELMRLRRSRLEQHPFFQWIESPETPLEKRFIFAPVMIDFIMGFADINKWFFSYAEPRNDLERAINQHTEEDRTHSQLFYDNWYSLDVGGVETWEPAKMLWWMFLARETASIRRFGMAILDLASNHEDPRIRFPLMEAIEICGDVFFGHTAPIAGALTEKQGLRHDYFGWFHRKRETGHLHADEDIFTAAVLTSDQREHARQAVSVVFDNFERVLDDLLQYSQRAILDERRLGAALGADYERAMARPPRALGTPWSGAGIGNAQLRGAQVELAALLHGRVERLSRHPFLRWLRDETSLSPKEKLQRFVAMWAVDIVGYRDFNELVLRYSDPGSYDEHVLNAWSAELASHAMFYLQDWRTLGLDSGLGWDPGETIAFYFLSAQTELHRHHMSQMKRYAFRHKEPVVRWWLMRAVEASGEPLFDAVRSLATTVEVAHGIVLDYWTGRHASAPIEPFGMLRCLASDPCPEDLESIREIIDVVFDNMEGLYSVSLDQATLGTFLAAPASLPPPRLSGIVLRARAEDSAQVMRHGT